MTYGDLIYPWGGFRVIWGLSGHYLIPLSQQGTKITKSAVVKIFWWGYVKRHILSSKMVLEGYFGAF